MPDFSLENKQAGVVAGLDEVGIGCWAGPVYACAVILPRDSQTLFQGLDDSKKISALRRESLFQKLTSHPDVIYGIGTASVKEIDSLNIRQAALLAMSRAYHAMGVLADHALVDGTAGPQLPCPVQTVVRGDGISLSIAAASVIAKVSRDQFMQDLGKDYPGYGFEHHAGYGTKTHQEALHKYGVTPWHRVSYAPIQKLLEMTNR